MAWVRAHGIEQFIQMWEKVKHLSGNEMKWGDELEYSILVLDQAAGAVRCRLRGAEILAELQEREKALLDHETSLPAEARGQHSCSWVPEYGAWMVEGTPAHPYSGFASDLLAVERNMRIRRAKLLSVLKEGEICPTLPCFPLIGVGQFTEPALPAGGRISDSLFIPDGAINPHPRFGALTGNIRKRRGSKVGAACSTLSLTQPAHGSRASPPFSPGLRWTSACHASVTSALRRQAARQAARHHTRWTRQRRWTRCARAVAISIGCGLSAEPEPRADPRTKPGGVSQPAPRCTWTRWPSAWAVAAFR